MSGPPPAPTPPKRSCHVWLTYRTWDAIAMEAAARGLSVSQLIEERLGGAASVQDSTPSASARPVNADSARLHRCYLRIDAELWRALSDEARRSGSSFAAIARTILWRGWRVRDSETVAPLKEDGDQQGGPTYDPLSVSAHGGSAIQQIQLLEL